MAICIVSPLMFNQKLVLADSVSGSQEDIQAEYGVLVLVAGSGLASMLLSGEL